jgi:phage gpG-like protein
MNLKLSIDGQAKFDGTFRVLREGITDLRPVWPEIELAFYRAELEQFNSEGGRGGAQWVPLSKGYAKWKEKKRPGQPILVLSGYLRRTLTAAGTPDTIRIHEPLSLTLGAGGRAGQIGGYHQRGTTKMPARPPLNLTRDDYGKFVSRIFRYVEKVSKDAGFEVKSTEGAQ